MIAITNPLTIPKPLDDGVYTKKKQILFVGRLTNQKGLNFLLPIWEEFTKCNKMNWGDNLVILGDGHCARKWNYIYGNTTFQTSELMPRPQTWQNIMRSRGVDE